MEDEVFRSYQLDKVSPHELLKHGHTEIMSKIFIENITPYVVERLASGVSNKFLVLELGGGTCYQSYYLKRSIKNGEIIASDISPFVLSVSKNLSNFFKTSLDNFCACDAQKLPFRENAFDIVFGTEFLHHCTSLYKAVQEIARVLRPSGLFLGIEPMCSRTSKPIIMFLSGARARTLHEHITENRYTYSQWKSAFEKADLDCSLSAIVDPKTYKMFIGKKCTPASFKGRYLIKYVYNKFLALIPSAFRKNAPNATLRIMATKKRNKS